MFDKLEDTLFRYEEVLNELSEPDVLNDQSRYQKLMKEQADLEPVVTKYKEYKAAKDGIEDSLAILEEESDEEMRELAKEELNECKASIGEIEQELRILLLPKDPNDDKNVIVEIRGAPVVMRPLYLQQIFIVCIVSMQRETTGRSIR